ncbi:hypothetical protein ACYF6T_20260 [Streptomyces sp. 7R007]
MGDPAQAGHLADIYRESVLSADFVAVASEWLGGVVAAHGARWDMVVESPAVRRHVGRLRRRSPAGSADASKINYWRLLDPPR